MNRIDYCCRGPLPYTAVHEELDNFVEKSWEKKDHFSTESTSTVIQKMVDEWAEMHWKAQKYDQLRDMILGYEAYHKHEREGVDVERDGEDEILLREVFENEVLERFTDHDTMNVPRILVKQLLKEVSEEEAVKLIEVMAKSIS